MSWPSELWPSAPWLELAIASALMGALCVSRLRDPARAWRCGLVFMGAAFLCSLTACLGFYLGGGEGEERVQPRGASLVLNQRTGRPLFEIDEMSAPLVPLVALLHFLTALATGRTKMRRFSLSWSLASEAIRLATFACLEPNLLIALLVAGTVPAYVELRNRGKPGRVYLLHLGLFVALMFLAMLLTPWGSAEPGAGQGAGHAPGRALATVAFLAAILIRCGTVPVHCWLTDWFEHASFGNALLFVTPLTGVYAVLRLVLPSAPDWMLSAIGIISLGTACYAAGMAAVQTDVRRFFAYLFLSHASLVLVGLELHTAISLTGALALWISTALSLAGLGLTLRALEARFGKLPLGRFHGLYDHSPALAVCFLVTGLGSVGFPGTLGFVATELLVDGAIEVDLLVGLVVALAAAVNGIAVIRAYFYLFTGTRHVSTVALGITPRERFAVLVLVGLIVGGGLFPQPGVASRYQAAAAILKDRESRLTAADRLACENCPDFP